MSIFMAFETLYNAAFSIISFCDLKIIARYNAFVNYIIRMFRAVYLDN
jgi:hypothetical protein